MGVARWCQRRLWKRGHAKRGSDGGVLSGGFPYMYMGVAPVIIYFSGISPYEPSILRYPVYGNPLSCALFVCCAFDGRVVREIVQIH